MQEAIEIIEERLKTLSIVQRTESTLGAIAGYQYSKYILMELLEKEKEQMIDFAMQMHKIDCSKTGTDLLFDEAESYYNQTYNQNK